MTKFVFFSDLYTPGLMIITDDEWAINNSDAIKNTPGISYYRNTSNNRPLRIGDMLYIPEEKDRLIFILRWS